MGSWSKLMLTWREIRTAWAVVFVGKMTFSVREPLTWSAAGELPVIVQADGLLKGSLHNTGPRERLSSDESRESPSIWVAVLW